MEESQREGADAGPTQLLATGTGTSLVRAAPGLARIAASAGWQAAGWTAGISLRVGSRVFRAAISGQAPRDLFETAGNDAREYLRRLLGIVDLDSGFLKADPETTAADGAAGNGRVPLRDRGAELLRRSADVDYADDFHPAYERMLDELAPDEARILRLLADQGPQPSVDVRSGWIPQLSDLVAPGLTMIGAEAGCRNPDRVPSYLNNLNRLGLVWFSRESLDDQRRYQVLEAQPEVAEPMERAGRSARTVRRSIHLTPFGSDFVEQCLPLEQRAQDESGPQDSASTSN
jgi:hypothetical protein